jgi:hypothetical protein
MEKLNQPKVSRFSLHSLKKFFLAGCVVTLAACGGGGGSDGPTPPPEKFPLAVNVIGFIPGADTSFPIINGDGIGEGNTILIPDNGTYHFNISVGHKYQIQVEIQPPEQHCVVTNGTGTGAKEMTPVEINCNATGKTYTVGGFLSGLQGGQVELMNNNTDKLAVKANGEFKFTNRVAHNSGYKITVLSHPVGHDCKVIKNGERPQVDGNVTDIEVHCEANAAQYTIGGTVNGLTSGTLVVKNNGAFDSKNITANGPFTFDKKLVANSPFTVSVVSPAGQICTPTHNTGTATGNITSVVVDCKADIPNNAFSISGTLTGLAPGQTITFLNNGVDPTTRMSADGSFTFPTKVVTGSEYAITVDEGDYPFLQQCNIANGTGTITNANVNNVVVACGVAPVVVTHSFPENDSEFFPVKLIQSKNDDGTNGPIYGAAASPLWVYTEHPSDPPVNPDPKTATSAYIFTMVNNVMSKPEDWKNFMGSGRFAPQYPLFPTGLMQARDGNIYGTTFTAATAWNDTRYPGFIPFGGATYKLNTKLLDFVQTDCMFFVSNNCKFTGTSNAGPVGDLIQDELTGNFYGVTFGDTIYKDSVGKLVQRQGGMLFKMTPDGTVTMLHDFGPFSEQDGEPVPAGAYPQGILPNGRLTLVRDTEFTGDTFVYGVTEKGGANGKGVVFKYNVTQEGRAGLGYSRVHSFENLGMFPPPQKVSIDIPLYDPYARPYSGLTYAEGNLYGVSKYGGAFNTGRIYTLNVLSGAVDTIYNFPAPANNNMYPNAELILAGDGNLYGTTQGSENKESSVNMGTIFKFNPKNCTPASCSSFSTLHSFKGAIQGGAGNRPSTRLVDGGDGYLYGGTRFGGIDNQGTIYKVGRN